jgi:hypothetical protein
MDEKTYDDDHFGTLRWDTDLDEWRGTVSISPHGEVGLGLPPEFPDSEEVQAHIHETLKIIQRDELSFRQRTADQLFESGAYHLWWPENQTFVRDVFINEMHLGDIAFNTEYPDEEVMLGYEYGGGMEHGILILLTWDGRYRYGRTM